MSLYLSRSWGIVIDRLDQSVYIEKLYLGFNEIYKGFLSFSYSEIQNQLYYYFILLILMIKFIIFINFTTCFFWSMEKIGIFLTVVQNKYLFFPDCIVIFSHFSNVFN